MEIVTRLGTKWVVFGAPGCSFCAKAKELLKSEEYTYVNVCAEEEELCESSLFQELKERNSWSTVPQVYLNGNFIGGYAALQEKLKTLNADEIRFDAEF